jgi:hypothetical protein
VFHCPDRKHAEQAFFALHYGDNGDGEEECAEEPEQLSTSSTKNNSRSAIKREGPE